MSQRRGDPVAQLADAVRQAKPVAALLSTDAQAVSATVDASLASLSDDPIRVVRVCGLPGTPLTLPRIVEEIGAGHRSGPRADDDELIVRVLATRSRGEDQVVLVLEQAELLPLPTLAFLQVALTVFGTRTPRLQLLFAGHPRFLHLIDHDELTPLRDRLGPVIRVQARLAGADLGPAMPGRVEHGGTAAATRRAGTGSSRRRWALAAVPALALGAAAAVFGTDWLGAALRPTQALAPPAPSAPIDPPPAARSLPGDVQPPSPPTLPPQAAEPETSPAPSSRESDVAAVPPPSPPSREPEGAAPPAPPSPPSRDPDMAALPAVPQPPSSSRERDAAASPPPPERRALPTSEQLARLRGEFDRFLSQTEWGSKKLSETERSRLFNEYLRWNYGTLAANPGTPP